MTICAFKMDRILRYCIIQLILTCSVTSDPEASVIDAIVGTDCDLPCSGPVGKVLVLEWIQTGTYLLFYRDGRIIQSYHDQRFKDRVELIDPDMKNGAFTVTLKNVTLDDTGTYRCEALVQTSGGKKAHFYNTVQLRVSGKAHEDTPRHEPQKDPKEETNLTPDNEPEMTHATTAPPAPAAPASNRSNLPVILGVTLPLVILLCAAVLVVICKRYKSKKSDTHTVESQTLSTPTTVVPSDEKPLV